MNEVQSDGPVPKKQATLKKASQDQAHPYPRKHVDKIGHKIIHSLAQKFSIGKKIHSLRRWESNRFGNLVTFCPSSVRPGLLSNRPVPPLPEYIQSIFHLSIYIIMIEYEIGISSALGKLDSWTVRFFLFCGRKEMSKRLPSSEFSLFVFRSIWVSYTGYVFIRPRLTLAPLPLLFLFPVRRPYDMRNGGVASVLAVGGCVDVLCVVFFLFLLTISYIVFPAIEASSFSAKESVYARPAL